MKGVIEREWGGLGRGGGEELPALGLNIFSCELAYPSIRFERMVALVGKEGREMIDNDKEM